MTNPTPAPQPNPYYAAPTVQRTNVLAIISLVASIVGISLAGIICGHIALSQIKHTGESGRGLAIAGLIVGYIGLVVGVILAIVFTGLAFSAWQDGLSTTNF